MQIHLDVVSFYVICKTKIVFFLKCKHDMNVHNGSKDRGPETPEKGESPKPETLNQAGGHCDKKADPQI